MRVTQFAKKYDLPAVLVYNASFDTPTRMQGYCVDIPEDELIDAVKCALQKTIKRHKDEADKNTMRLQRLLVASPHP